MNKGSTIKEIVAILRTWLLTNTFDLPEGDNE